MTIQTIVSTAAGIVFLLGFAPYIIAIVRGETKPSKASWVIWASLDTITIVGMYFKDTLNGQIFGAVIGAWAVVALALIYGKPGWTKLDMQCFGGAVFGIALWLTFDEPTIGIVVSNIVVFIGAIPTFKSAWKNPEQEDRLAWTIFWISCVLAVIAIPHWTLADATQPVVFFSIESIMMYLLFVHARKQIIIQ